MVDRFNQKTIHFIYDSGGDLTGFVNVRGDTITYAYDGNHNLTEVRDYMHNIIVKNTYNASNKVIFQRDVYDNPTQIDYNDPEPNATRLIEPLGVTKTYFHDDQFRIVKIQDTKGYTINYEYDNAHNLPSLVFDNTGRQVSWAYTIDGFISKVTDAYDNSTEFSYENSPYGFPTKITNALNNEVKIDYNTKWQPSKVTRPKDVTIEFFYDFYGKPSLIRDEESKPYIFGYDNNRWDVEVITTPTGDYNIKRDVTGHPIAITDRNYKTDSITTDAYGNITRLKDPLGYTQEWQYNANGYVTSYKNKDDKFSYFKYDKRDLLTAIINTKKDTTIFSYDALGRRIQIRQPAGNTIDYKYNNTSRLVEVKNALGSYQFKYDLVGNRTHVITPTKDTTKIVYDLLNRPTVVINALGDTIQQVAYDVLSRPIKVIDGKSNTQTYYYDALNRLDSIIDPTGGVVSFTRDKKRRIKAIKDANKKLLEYTRNELGLVTAIKYDNKLLSSASYDNEGYLKTATHNGITATFQRDNNYRPERITYSNNHTYQFRWESNGWLKEVTKDNWATKMSFVRDEIGNITQSTDTYGTTIAYAYDKNQNRTQVILPGDKTITTTYNNANLPEQTSDWLGNSQKWVYNANGNIDSVINSNNTQTVITWDILQRMKSYKNLEKNSNIINSYEFTYDKNYQIIDTKAYQPLNLTLTPKTDAYTYAEGGRMTAMNGEPVVTQTSGEVLKMDKFKNPVWEENDLLISYINGNDTIQNSFDPLGQRIKRVKNSQETRYTLDQSGSLSHVLQESDNNGNLQRYYIQTPYGLGWNIDGSSEQPQFYHFSYNGNTIGLTNNEGILTDKYASTIFGDFPTHEGSSTQPYQFGGQYGIQRETGSLYHVRARTLNGYTGSFMSQDAYPVSPTNSQSFNRYHYGYNDPVSYVDFDGFQASAQGLLPYYERSSYVGVTSPYDYLTNSVVFVQNTLGATYNEAVNTVEYELEMYPITVLFPVQRMMYETMNTAEGLYTLATNTNVDDISTAISQPATYEYVIGSLLVPSPNKSNKVKGITSRLSNTLNQPYKHIPIKQADLDHVIERHWYNSTASNAGKFLPGLTPKKLQQMVNEAVDRNKSFANRSRYGNIKEGFVFHHNFDHWIGVSINGNITNRLRVVLYPDGNLKTTFPED